MSGSMSGSMSVSRSILDPSTQNLVKLSGVVERVTYHNVENGWSVLKVAPFAEPGKLATVVLHQAKVFAGSSMEFWGHWAHHPKHGDQFKAVQAIEKKPASSAALEKYLGSGLIKGVGPVTASRIVRHFKERTLEVFEEHMDELLRVPGIAEKKLLDIKNSWAEHKAIRDVMMFLQSYGISTLFAVKIFKTYGDKAIAIVSENPYRLAKDIYGIGFFSADKIALSMGFAEDGAPRIEAGVKHILASAREAGHCFLVKKQILESTVELLKIEDREKIESLLQSLLQKNEIKCRHLKSPCADEAYYSNSLYYDEQAVAEQVLTRLGHSPQVDGARVKKWVKGYCQKHSIQLSDEQEDSVLGIVGKSFSILTGGPGCGKTTTTKVLVKLLQAMGKKVALAAPTGRAAQRMSEVIGQEAKTLHRLLEWEPKANGFRRCEEEPLATDFLIVDECSMLDISLAAALLKAVPPKAQVLWIGDPDQLPSVGAGNVLQDLLRSPKLPVFRLTKVFRQAEESLIVRYAHQINRGLVPKVESPFHKPDLWHKKASCLFIDAEEATQEQIKFLRRAKAAMAQVLNQGEEQLIQQGDQVTAKMIRSEKGPEGPEKPDEPGDSDESRLLIQKFDNPLDRSEVQAPVFVIPERFRHVQLEQLQLAQNQGAVAELKTLLRAVHPWSALHYGLSALDVVLHLYQKTIPRHFGSSLEVQVLSPQVRGSLGTLNLNAALQQRLNPEAPGRPQMRLGERIFRLGDRVIQTRNNYDLGVFNGDIGQISAIDFESGCLEVSFGKGPSPQVVTYERQDLSEISLAYAITVHKSQGSEFDAVIIPVSTQHFKMLFRNLIYTGLTRAKKLCVFVGSRKALSMAVGQMDQGHRQTALTELIDLPS